MANVIHVDVLIPQRFILHASPCIPSPHYDSLLTSWTCIFTDRHDIPSPHPHPHLLVFPLSIVLSFGSFPSLRNTNTAWSADPIFISTAHTCHSWTFSFPALCIVLFIHLFTLPSPDTSNDDPTMLYTLLHNNITQCMQHSSVTDFTMVLRIVSAIF